MGYLLEDSSLYHAALRDFRFFGAETVRDTESALVLKKGGIFYGAGRVDECEEFRQSAMALALDAQIAAGLMQEGCFDEDRPVLQYVYRGPLPQEPSGDFHLKMLTRDDVPFLVENYHNPSATEKHLTERVEDGLMLGIYRNGQCMGFAGTHEEGSMGMLEILPAFRRQGLAEVLETALIRRLLQAGRIPYCHVLPSNEASRRLQEKIGLRCAPRPVVWLCKHELYYSTRLY